MSYVREVDELRYTHFVYIAIQDRKMALYEKRKKKEKIDRIFFRLDDIKK